MALRDRKPISTKPGGPHADKGTPTEYRASQGGWYPVKDKPVPGTPRNGEPREAR
ncbi:hypothetical protein [Streptomyces sp. NPDC045251]|uniref:hypothetical protein n=1 Tax=unclassified Streptomyces TaxID=2593676 RepID=UPI0033EA0A35